MSQYEYIVCNVEVYSCGPNNSNVKQVYVGSLERLLKNITLDHRSRFALKIYRHHHHHVMLVARISLTLSHRFSLSFIASGRSSEQHPVSSHSCWMYVRAGRPAFARPCVGVHKSTSLMSSSLLVYLHICEKFRKNQDINPILKWEIVKNAVNVEREIIM